MTIAASHLHATVRRTAAGTAPSYNLLQCGAFIRRFFRIRRIRGVGISLVRYFLLRRWYIHGGVFHGGVFHDICGLRLGRISTKVYPKK